MLATTWAAARWTACIQRSCWPVQLLLVQWPMRWWPPLLWLLVHLPLQSSVLLRP